jgi:hypothetical protein
LIVACQPGNALFLYFISLSDNIFMLKINLNAFLNAKQQFPEKRELPWAEG